MLHSPGPTEQSPASVGITRVNVNCAWAVCQWSMYRPGYTGLAWSPPMAALTRCAVTQCPPLTPGLQPDADGCETRNCLSSPARAEHQTHRPQPAPALLGGAQAQSTPALIHFYIKSLALSVRIIPFGLLLIYFCICGAQKELLELKESL